MRNFTVLEPFTTMLSKCRNYTPEPRFQATNRAA